MKRGELIFHGVERREGIPFYRFIEVVQVVSHGVKDGRDQLRRFYRRSPQLGKQQIHSTEDESRWIDIEAVAKARIIEDLYSRIEQAWNDGVCLRWEDVDFIAFEVQMKKELGYE